LHTLELNGININYGFRINHYGVSAHDEEFGDIRNSSTALVGNLGLTYKILPGLAAVASVNSGFRSPNIDDLTKFGRFDFGFEVPVSDLKPEKSLNTELGLKIYSDHISGSLAFYRNNLFDLIDRVRSTYMGNILYLGDTVYRKSNVDQAYIQGAEIEAGININPVFTVFGSMMYIIGNTNEGEPLRRIPPLNGSIGIRYKNSEGFSGRAEMFFAGKQDRLSGGDISDHRIPAGGTPGWGIFNLYAGYVIKKLTFNAGILNLADETYKTHGSGIYGYGRCAQLSVRLAF
jgi:outer membrane receptor protein involved in Fe transport